MTHFSKSPIRRLTCLILAILLTAGVFAVSATAEQSVTVEPIAFRNPDFVRGMDVSSVIALEKSGVIFRNRDGDREDIFKILADNGVNTIRVRVWNDPYDSNGNGYGGGNNDVATAAKIGQRAAKYGLNLLVDFHYSDFWADPGKQKAPKAWANMTLSEKTAALKAFTTESLKTIRDAGAHITMVQIGNETNLGIAGENSWTNMAQLYNAGSQAVREFSSEIRVMIHYTNPENTYIRTMADFLHDYQVDYDIFATSYYPCWHGSLENLTDTLS
ncbi:MAG: glycosyl hydrolase 53 family protein, partial [Ruminococcus sp.]|nr:glycosyl hydrolase 53 family protein [Ruminococcus sp.]